MTIPMVVRLYRRVLRLLPGHVRHQDLREMVDTFAEMWREARGLGQGARVIMAVLVPFPRLWIAEWWDAMTDLYSGDHLATAYAVRMEAMRRPTPLPPIAVRVTPLVLALVMCASSVVMASRFASLAGEAMQNGLEVLVTALFVGLAFLVVVTCSSASSLIKPTSSAGMRRR